MGYSFRTSLEYCSWEKECSEDATFDVEDGVVDVAEARWKDGVADALSVAETRWEDGVADDVETGSTRREDNRFVVGEGRVGCGKLGGNAASRGFRVGLRSSSSSEVRSIISAVVAAVVAAATAAKLVSRSHLDGSKNGKCDCCRGSALRLGGMREDNCVAF